ncbi:glycoside hydrolase [Bisporella sp. PMI_857]|nr:glycoside hydrolase [Bisporella sp. PMI_857]
MLLVSSFIFLTLSVPSAFGHGHVKSLILNSATYTGYLPVATPDFNADAPSISRKIGAVPVDGPVINQTSTDITCNFNAVPINDAGVSRTGPITAGTNISFHWNGFTHSGPMFTYLAKCTPDCGSFTGTTTKSWFKIDQRGYDTKWATQYLFDQGNVWYTKIPECIEPGEYLVRHEIIALSACSVVGKCQFYPSCHQVKVLASGKATKAVSSDYLVTFPGGYSPTEPGILWNTNTQLPANYVMPGVKLFTC